MCCAEFWEFQMWMAGIFLLFLSPLHHPEDGWNIKQKEKKVQRPMVPSCRNPDVKRSLARNRSECQVHVTGMCFPSPTPSPPPTLTPIPECGRRTRSRVIDGQVSLCDTNPLC